MSKFNAFLRDESGAAAAEYVLILAIIGAAIATAATTFGNTVVNALQRGGSVITAVKYS